MTVFFPQLIGLFSRFVNMANNCVNNLLKNSDKNLIFD